MRTTHTACGSSLQWTLGRWARFHYFIPPLFQWVFRSKKKSHYNVRCGKWTYIWNFVTLLPYVVISTWQFMTFETDIFFLLTSLCSLLWMSFKLVEKSKQWCCSYDEMNLTPVCSTTSALLRIFVKRGKLSTWWILRMCYLCIVCFP